MPSFVSWAPVLGPAVAEAAQAYSESVDELSERNQKRAQAAQAQMLRPLETQARATELRKQIRTADQPTFHPYAGGYALVYPDGRVEPHAWPPGMMGGKQTAATRKLQELAQLAQSDDPLVANAAKGELSRFAHAGDPKDLQVLQKYMAMQRGEIPYDQAVDEYMQQKYREYQAKIPERGLAPLPAPTMPQVQGQVPPTPAPQVQGQAPAAMTPAPPGEVTSPAAPGASVETRPENQQLFTNLTQRFQKIGKAAAAQQVQRYAAIQNPEDPWRQSAVAAYQAAFGELPPGAAAAQGPAPVSPQPAAPTAQAPLLQGRQGQTPRYTAQTVVDQAKALGFGHQEIAAAQQLFPYKSFSDLTADDVKQVRQAIEDIKNQKGFQQVFRQASPLIGELNSLDEAASMAKELEPLITPERVGIRGKAKRFSQGIAYQYPDYAKSLGITFDPAIQDIETLSHIIGYLHANAVKRGAGGGTGVRGVTRYDIQAIEAWLDPFAMTATAPGLKASLARIQQAIQHMRPQVENDLQVLGVDPKTKGPLARNYGGVVLPEAAPPAGAETPEPTGNDLVDKE